MKISKEQKQEIKSTIELAWDNKWGAVPLIIILYAIISSIDWASWIPLFIILFGLVMAAAFLGVTVLVANSIMYVYQKIKELVENGK